MRQDLVEFLVYNTLIRLFISSNMINMQSKYIYLIIILLVVVVAWFLWSWLSVKDIEEPAYTVLEEKEGYEIREYAPYIIAETQVTGSYNEAMNQGFRIIANYIFGDNTKQEPIAMTVPVSESEAESVSESIAMTTPVTEISNEENPEEHLISFTMPSKYTLETLPLPNDDRVLIKQIPKRITAVSRFSWYNSEKRFDQKKRELLNLLESDGISVTGAPEVARYNPPFTVPFLLRSEIIIPIER